jgi:hypothetical protein
MLSPLSDESSGNALVVAASTSTVVGMTWGGTQYSWTSAKVLAPLILGISGLGLFLVYEAKLAKHPVVRGRAPWTRGETLYNLTPYG